MDEMPPTSPPHAREGVDRRAKNVRRKRENPNGVLKRLAAGLMSLAGIATATATITTSAAAVLGILAHTKDEQLQQAHAQASSQAQQIKHQAQRIEQLQKEITTPSASPSPTTTSSSAQVGGVLHYLANTTPTADNASLQTSQEVISAKPYDNSIRFNCDSGINATPDGAFDVAGSSTFTAEVGIPDDMEGATGVIATVIFSNESGQQVGQRIQVSLGHPVSLELNIKGVTQLGMTCDGRDRQTNQAASGFEVAMGDAGVS